MTRESKQTEGEDAQAMPPLPDDNADWPVHASPYDRWVRMMRVLATVTALVTGALVFLLPLLHKQPLTIHVAREKLERHRGAIVVMAPRYRGVDDRGRPFLISAARALQATVDAPDVVLEDLNLSLVMADGRTVSLRAPHARYFPEQDHVVLTRLEGRSSDGYVFRSADGTLAIKERRLSLAGPVTGAGPLGRFTARGAVYNAESRRLVLQGPVMLTITPRTKG